MTPALPRQHANIAAGLCRYGADHPRPKPGQHVCAGCQDDRSEAGEKRRSDMAMVYGACARQTATGKMHASPLPGKAHCETCLAQQLSYKPSKGMRLCKACGRRGHFAKTCRRRELISSGVIAA